MSIDERERPVIKGEDAKRFLANEKEVNKILKIYGDIEKVKIVLKNKLPKLRSGVKFTDKELEYLLINAKYAVMAFIEILEEELE
jgi:hypothetical protein